MPTGSMKTDSNSNSEGKWIMDVYKMITDRIIEKLEAGDGSLA